MADVLGNDDGPAADVVRCKGCEAREAAVERLEHVGRNSDHRIWQLEQRLVAVLVALTEATTGELDPRSLIMEAMGFEDYSP